MDFALLRSIIVYLVIYKAKYEGFRFPPLAGGIEGGGQGGKIDSIPSTWSFCITRIF
jgi:hypothetical protein